MKNVMVANLRPGADGHPRYGRGALEQGLRAQIDNALECGWAVDDIVVAANFPFMYEGVVAMLWRSQTFCWTGSKVFGLAWVWDAWPEVDEVWLHDLDVWQNVPFAADGPEFGDVGLAEYSQPKFNGGSAFWRRSGEDILQRVLFELTRDKCAREEPTLNRVLRNAEYKERVTVLNETWNVGCSGWAKRMARAVRPVRCAHLHPYNRLAWETHVLDRNGTGERSVSDRLERLIRKHYGGLATELKRDKKKKERLEC